MLRYFPWRDAALASAVLSFIFVLHVGAYYALVMRGIAKRSNSFSSSTPMFVPVYRFGNGWAEHLFSFWHRLDRQIRRRYWTYR
jgi:hypothetical protein